MNKHLTLFDNHSDYNTYITGDPVLPNVSYCKTQDEVHYNPFVPETRLVIKYNVTDTSTTTKLCNSISVSEFIEIEIDGVVQPSVVDTYTFDTTGEHTVKYTLIDGTTLGQNAATFFNCTNIIKAIIPNGVTSISTVFYGCTNLTSVTIPDSVTTIGSNAFNGCSGLTSITIPDSVTTIGQSAFYGCTNLTSINIPNSVENIALAAFQNCSSLINVTIPNNITTINQASFLGCSSLTSIIIPNSVTYIDSGAFYQCTGLTSVTIGSGVTFIHDGVFNDCSSLISVTLLSITPPTQHGKSFENNANNRKIYVPAASVEAYKAASVWSTYSADIEAIPQ